MHIYLILSIFFIYLFGCVFAYFRWNACFYDYKNETIGTDWIVILLSWIGFLIGLIFYFAEHDKYFLKINRI